MHVRHWGGRFTAILGFAILLLPAWPTAKAATADQWRGFVVREDDGRIWYIPKNSTIRYALANQSDMKMIVRLQAVGVSSKRLATIPTTVKSPVKPTALQRRLAGTIVIEPEARGRLWYIDPATYRKIYLGNLRQAVARLTALATDISDAALFQIPIVRDLAVPYTVQAPYGRWDGDHNEFCEEASALMVARYWRNQSITGRADAEYWLQQTKAWELAHLGFHYDTSAADTARILREFYGLSADVVTHPTAVYMRQMLDQGKPLIITVAGRQLLNPNFRGLGPDYHVLVVKGYRTDGYFITQEPGTSRGRNYLYRQDIIMKALHDYNNGQPATGTPTIIVTGPAR